MQKITFTLDTPDQLFHGVASLTTHEMAATASSWVCVCVRFILFPIAKGESYRWLVLATFFLDSGLTFKHPWFIHFPQDFGRIRLCCQCGLPAFHTHTYTFYGLKAEWFCFSLSPAAPEKKWCWCVRGLSLTINTLTPNVRIYQWKEREGGANSIITHSTSGGRERHSALGAPEEYWLKKKKNSDAFSVFAQSWNWSRSL